jgi:hypothetical protein
MRSTGVVAAMTVAVFLAAPFVDAAEPQSPRLKYRSKALTCTCATGMSEADISRAMDARFKGSGEHLDKLDEIPKIRDEQRRRVDEEQSR